MKKLLHKNQEEGQGLVEYALLLVLIAVVIIAVLTILGDSVMVVFARVVGGLTGQTITGTGTEVIILSMDATATCGGASCTVNVNQMSFMGLQDGQPIENGSVSIPLIVSGSASPRSGSTNGSGMGTVSSFTLSGDNPLYVTMDNGYRMVFP